LKNELNIHGTSVTIGDQGVLILGPSGSGKSDLALRLIDRGATLISDDRTICNLVNKEIFMFSPSEISGLIEIRGMGLIRVPYIDNVKLKMIIKLTNKKMDRFPKKYLFKKILGVSFPLFQISAFDISANAKINLKLFEISQNE
tara:strand:+ start:499 stop:930 length:432 start_codon:yes stop_codon:yes gene_type:complete